MPSGKSFDPQQKIDEAVDLFWREGYAATGVQDVVENLQISRSSLYATFGDKDTLWQRALSRYCQERNIRLAAVLDGAPPVLPRIRALLENVIAARPAEPRGCLVVNAICERLADDDTTRTTVTAQLAHVEAALADALQRAQTAGEIDAGNSPRDLARFLLTVIEGLHVLDRAGTNPDRLDDVITTAMGALPKGPDKGSNKGSDASRPDS